MVRFAHGRRASRLAGRGARACPVIPRLLVCALAWPQPSSSLALQKLGVTGCESGKLIAPVEQESFPLERSCAAVSVPPRDFRLLFLVPPGGKEN